MRRFLHGLVSHRHRRRVFAFIVCIHLALLTHGIYLHFPNEDEIGHLPAGVSIWKFNRFDLYRVNPPLVHIVSGIPGSFGRSDYQFEMMNDLVGRRPEFAIGNEHLLRKGLAVHGDFILPRLCCLCFSLLAVWILAEWAFEVTGTCGSICITILWCFCPNILAHAQTIVPDVGAVAMGVLLSFAAWKYVQRPSRLGAASTGFWFGMAMLSKLTWLTGAASIPVAIVVCSLLKPFRHKRTYSSILLDLLAFVGVGLLVLNSGYLFEGTCTPLSKYEFCSDALGGSQAGPSTPNNRFQNSFMGMLPVPLPRNFVLGVDYLRYEVESKKWSYLNGEWKNGSWWYYYLVTTAVKTPLPSLLGAFLGVIMIFRHGSPSLRASVLLLCIPSAIAFASVSLQGGFNHHHRYVLFIYPALFFLMAGLCSLERNQARWQKLTVSLCILSTVSSLWVSPHFLSYFNALVGGPNHGWKVLSNSNIDWGQDLLLVDQWLRSHPECRPCGLEMQYSGLTPSFFGLEDVDIPRLQRLDIANFKAILGDTPSEESFHIPELPEDGWYIVNVRALCEFPDAGGLAYFQSLTPIDQIGYSFRVYRIGPTERELLKSIVRP